MSANIDEDLTNSSNLNEMFTLFEKDNIESHQKYTNDTLDKENWNYGNHIANTAPNQLIKKKKIIKGRKSLLKRRSPQLKTKRMPKIMFSTSTKQGKILSPDVKSKNSIQSRIELQNVLKEAYEFLNEPDIIYTPPKDTSLNITNWKYDVYKMKKEEQILPKVESIEEFVKSRINRSYSQKLRTNKDSFHSRYF